MKKTLIALMLFASIPFHAQAQSKDDDAAFRSFIMVEKMMRDGMHEGEFNNDIIRDKKGFLEFYQFEAEMGSQFHQRMTGYCYFYGIGTPQDINEAKNWFVKAIINGDEWAKIAVKRIFRLEKQGRVRNGKLVR